MIRHHRLTALLLLQLFLVALLCPLTAAAAPARGDRPRDAPAWRPARPGRS